MSMPTIEPEDVGAAPAAGGGTEAVQQSNMRQRVQSQPPLVLGRPVAQVMAHPGMRELVQRQADYQCYNLRD